MSVRNLMNAQPKSVHTDASVAEVARIMEQNRCGAVPIVNHENRPVGIVTDRDICLGLGRRGRPAAEVGVTELMSKHVYACGPDDSVSDALATMQAKRIRRLPVVDARGHLIGMLSMDDMILKAGSEAVELGYRQTIDTLKAIYRRAASPTVELIARA